MPLPRFTLTDTLVPHPTLSRTFGPGARGGLPGAGFRRRAGHVQLPAADKPGGERSRWAVAGNSNAPGAVLSRGPIRRKVGFRPESNFLDRKSTRLTSSH